MSRGGKALTVTFCVAILAELALGRVLVRQDVIAAILAGELLVPAGLALLYAARLTLLVVAILMTHRFAAWGAGLARR